MPIGIKYIFSKLTILYNENINNPLEIKINKPPKTDDKSFILVIHLLRWFIKVVMLNGGGVVTVNCGVLNAFIGNSKVFTDCNKNKSSPLAKFASCLVFKVWLNTDLVNNKLAYCEVKE